MSRLRAGLVLAILIPLFSASAQEKELKLGLGSNVALEMVLVEKGTFEQGSPASEKGRNEEESQREVTLTKSFYLGKYPITRKQFAQFVRETGYKTEAEKGPSGGFGWEAGGLKQKKEYTWRNPGFSQTDEHPVVLVTYDDVHQFLTWAIAKTGRKLTLPTEAQWEYAARAGTTTAYCTGDDEEDLAQAGWYQQNAGDGTRPVGEKRANAWGLFDMHGNVYEWCRDWYAPYESGPLTDPEQIRADLSDKPRRVLRGGAFHKEARHCRSAARYRNDPKSRNADNGFRVALLIEEAKPARSTAQPTPPPKPTEPPRPVDPPKPTEPPIAVEAPLPSGPAKSESEAHGSAEHGHDHGPGNLQGPVRVVQRRSAFNFGAGGLCCCAGVGVLGLALVAVLVVRMFGGSGATDYGGQEIAQQKPVYSPSPPSDKPRPQSPTSRIRVGEDGFWIDVSGIVPQSTVEYRYTAQGATHFEHAVVTGSDSEIFVYSGSRPASAEVVNIVPPGGHLGGGVTSRPGAPSSSPVHPGAILMMPPFSPTPPKPSKPEPFRGYPSAY